MKGKFQPVPEIERQKFRHLLAEKERLGRMPLAGWIVLKNFLAEDDQFVLSRWEGKHLQIPKRGKVTAISSVNTIAWQEMIPTKAGPESGTWELGEEHSFSDIKFDMYLIIPEGSPHFVQGSWFLEGDNLGFRPAEEFIPALPTKWLDDRDYNRLREYFTNHGQLYKKIYQGEFIAPDPNPYPERFFVGGRPPRIEYSPAMANQFDWFRGQLYSRGVPVAMHDRIIKDFFAQYPGYNRDTVTSELPNFANNREFRFVDDLPTAIDWIATPRWHDKKGKKAKFYRILGKLLGSTKLLHKGQYDENMMVKTDMKTYKVEISRFIVQFATRGAFTIYSGYSKEKNRLFIRFGNGT